MWIFSITSGKLYLKDNDGQLVYKGIGYSGFKDARGRPDKASEKAIGPIPPGRWHIGVAYKHASLGPVVMNLTPYEDTKVFDRDLFRIHGDNSTPDPWDGSHGCIILNRMLRELIAASNVTELLVITSESEYQNETPVGLK